MKKYTNEELEARNIEIKQKGEELRHLQIKDELHAAPMEELEEKGVEKIKDLHQGAKSVLNANAAQFALQLQRTHRLGQVHGKFHPSKSKKGIKRSEY